MLQWRHLTVVATIVLASLVGYIGNVADGLINWGW